MNKLINISTIVFDADDTLWANETRFREAERKAAEALASYCDADTMSSLLYSIEVKNMADYGFGAKAFVLSMLETAVSISNGKVSGKEVQKILEAGRWLLHNPATPLAGVEETLRRLKKEGRYRMAVLTKGDLLDQERKLQRSGLLKYFDYVEITSDKSVKEYSSLCKKLGIDIKNMAMVGNSFKSDIAPVLELGGVGIHIPFEVIWELEKMEEYDHPNLFKLKEFKDLESLLFAD